MLVVVLRRLHSAEVAFHAFFAEGRQSFLLEYFFQQMRRSRGESLCVGMVLNDWHSVVMTRL